MKKLFFLLSFLMVFFLGNLSAQESMNMEELYNYDLSEDFNDCWGYADDEGNEYAIVGTKKKILFFNVTDPDDVTLVDEFSNSNVSEMSVNGSIWRDFKTFGDKAYACAQKGGEGLLVFDLSGLPTEVTFEEQHSSSFTNAHNIFIDTNSGYLYVAGANTEYYGLIVLDIDSDPITEVASEYLGNNKYVHDLYVRNDTAYCSHGNPGFYVWDFTTPTDPDLVGSLSTGGYNHSSWLTEDGDYAFFAEEIPIGRSLGVIDLTDFGNLDVDVTFKEPLLAPDHMNNRPHNPYVRDDFLIVSYYHDGVQIFDISDPLDPELVGYYDTYPANTSYTDNYPGCWGVYPYLPSGNIIASDINNGFFLLEFTEPPLPVELTHFSARSVEKKVKLTWATASEANSELFEVQKSADGENSETIARIAAAGESDSNIDYVAFDKNPFLGDNYYRLKQIDMDGTFKLSEIEVVRFTTSPIDVFPTLVTSDEPLKILFSKKVSEWQVQIYSAQGQLMRNLNLSGGNGLLEELQHDDLPNGAYIVQASSNNYQVTKRIVIAR